MCFLGSSFNLLVDELQWHSCLGGNYVKSETFGKVKQNDVFFVLFIANGYILAQDKFEVTAAQGNYYAIIYVGRKNYFAIFEHIANFFVQWIPLSDRVNSAPKGKTCYKGVGAFNAMLCKVKFYLG